jgi:hypothetical protein
MRENATHSKAVYTAPSLRKAVVRPGTHSRLRGLVSWPSVPRRSHAPSFGRSSPGNKHAMQDWSASTSLHTADCFLDKPRTINNRCPGNHMRLTASASKLTIRPSPSQPTTYKHLRLARHKETTSNNVQLTSKRTENGCSTQHEHEHWQSMVPNGCRRDSRWSTVGHNVWQQLLAEISFARSSSIDARDSQKLKPLPASRPPMQSVWSQTNVKPHVDKK